MTDQIDNSYAPEATPTQASAPVGGFGVVPSDTPTPVESPVAEAVTQPVELPAEPVQPVVAHEDNGVIIPGNDTPPISQDKAKAIGKIIPSVDKVNNSEIDHTKHAKVVIDENEEIFTYDKDKTYIEAIMDADVSISMPTEDPMVIRDILDQRPSIDPTLTEDGNNLVVTLQEGDRMMPGHEVLRSAVHDESREFMSYLLDEKGSKLHAVNPTMNPPGANGKKLTGEAAVIRIQSMIGLGGVVHIPLWHSGFWVTIKTPTDLQLIDLHEQTLQGKIEAGRNMFGLGFSNDLVYLMEPVMNLFINCIYTTSLKSGTQDLWKKIKIHDFQTICWGLACAIWPNGFQYTRSILDEEDPSGARDRIISAKLNVRKLLWVDNKAISDYQRKHMTDRFGKNMTDESLDTYAKGFDRPMSKRIHLGDMLYVDLKVPSVEENVTNGERWVTDIKNMLEEVLTTVEDGNSRRSALLRDYSRATLMCQYGHWVESVVMVYPDGTEEVISDKDTIYLILNRFSGNDEMRENFISGVIQFISDSAVSIIGIPTVKEDEENKRENYPHLLPLDALLLFFSLLVQKVSKVTQ